MGEYTFRILRKFLCATLVFSLLWPDLARCMQDDEEKDFQSSPPKILEKNLGDLKNKKSSSENLKIEVEVKEEIKEIPPQTETIQEKKEPIQPLLPKKEEIIEEKLTLTEAKPKEEELKNTNAIETNPSHDPKKEEEKENQDTKFSNNSSEKNNPEIPNQITEEEFSSGKEVLDIITIKENKRNDESLDYSLFQEKKPNSLCSCFKGIFNCCTKKKFEMKAPSEESPLLINEDKRETPSQKYARLLNLDLEEWGKEEQTAWEDLLKVEGTWRNPLIWANLENLIHKTLFALTTNKSAITKKKGEKAKKCCDPLWLYGGPVPLMDSSAIKRNVTLKTLGNAFQDGVTDTIETILTGLLGYQVYELIKTGTWKVLTFKKLIEFYEGADNTSYIAVINTLSEHPALFALFAIPIGFAVIKTLWNVSHISKPTEENIKKTVESLHDPKSDKWDSKFFSLISLIPSISSLLMFHPTKSAIPGLALPILWKGDLDPEDREKAFNAIVHLANKRKGLTQMTAIESLKYLAHGMHPKNLMNRPHSVEELAKIKAGALHELQEVYKKLHPLSINKARTAMHLWEIGQNPSLVVSIVAPVIKAALVAFYGYSLYQIGSFLIDYFKCSNKYKTRFSWLNSVHPGYVNDFNKDCFDAQVKAFNLIPGQPAYTLVGHYPASTAPGNLSSYYFPNKTYDLDLSNKGLGGEIIADIVEGFKLANATVSLRSLNIANNVIGNSSHLKRILAALPPGIRNLDIMGISPLASHDAPLSATSFLKIGYLTNLQSLNVSNNILSPASNGVIGEILQNLFQLQDLSLEVTETNLTQVAHSLKSSLRRLDLKYSLGLSEEGQIALGNALQNLTLPQFYLGYTGIGKYAKANIALAQGLSYQRNLSILDLNTNILGIYSSVNVSTLLRSLPSSLTYLDVGENSIGSQDSSEVTALAKAVQKMLGLAFFRAGNKYSGNNALGNSSTFLGALQSKKHLTFLDLSQNSFNNITEIRNFLKTIPCLEVLDFSNNQLTNGSLLAPVLSKLKKLKKLNFGGNKNFTTEDRLAIWNSTSSFLIKSPFYLDEDLNFTSSYLQSLLPTTKTLNFSSLIQNNPTAFKIIMNQTFKLFPNLEELDLSNNCILKRNSETNKLETEGIEALILLLPQLKHLQSLSILNSEGSDSQEAYPYYQNFSYTIGQLPNLRTLDLSGSQFFFADFLGKGLEKSDSLISVDFSYCWGQERNIAPHQWEGGAQLIKGLAAHHNLTKLNLSFTSIGVNSFGYPDPNSTLALTNALQSWPQLQSLNLAQNSIGWEDPNSSISFLQKLADLAVTVNNKTGKTLKVNLLNGLYNVTWTNESHVFQKLTENSILNACARQLCSGGNITTQSKTKAPKFQEERAIEPMKKTYGSHHKHPHIKPVKKVHRFSKERHIESITKIQDFQEEQSIKLVKKDHSLQEELNAKPMTNTHELQEVLMTEPITSSATQLAPFYQPLVNTLKPWFSLESWSVWGDRVLDSVANGILSYSKQVAENAPGYFPGTLDKSKSPAEGRNKTFRNYPIPHFRAIDQGEPLDVQRFNHMQALPQSQGFNHTSSPLMISGGFQPLMITK